MSIDRSEPSRPLPDRPNLRHLKHQAKDLLEAGAAASIAEAQYKIARLYGFASWPKLKAHIGALDEIGQLKQAIDSNALTRSRGIRQPRPPSICSSTVERTSMPAQQSRLVSAGRPQSSIQ